MNALDIEQLQRLVSKWEQAARRKFLDAGHADSEHAKRFLENGAWCYFNCAMGLREFLGDEAPPPLATQPEQQT